jgi:hypothetical protein
MATFSGNHTETADCNLSRKSFLRAIKGLFFLIFPLSVLAFLDLTCSSEEGDQFWRELGLSQNPDSILREILERREFKDSFKNSLVAALMRWFLELITRLANRLFGKWRLDFEGEIVWTAVGAFFAVVLVAAVIVCLYFVAKAFFARDTTAEDSDPEFHDATESSSELLSVSHAKAEAGEYGEALIYLFRYVLTRLDEQGRLGFYTGKTNREILRSPNLKKIDRAILSEMIPIFNRVRYGGFLCAKGDYEEFRSLARRLVQALEAP